MMPGMSLRELCRSIFHERYSTKFRARRLCLQRRRLPQVAFIQCDRTVNKNHAPSDQVHASGWVASLPRRRPCKRKRPRSPPNADVEPHALDGRVDVWAGGRDGADHNRQFCEEFSADYQRTFKCEQRSTSSYLLHYKYRWKNLIAILPTNKIIACFTVAGLASL